MWLIEADHQENAARPFALQIEAVKMFETRFPLFSTWPPARIIAGNAVVCVESCRRFGGGSDRNRALLGNRGNSMHDMQFVQGRINTGDFASR